MMGDYCTGIAKRGRPTTAKVHRFGTAGVESSVDALVLRDTVAQVLPKMPPNQLDKLTEMLVAACGHFAALSSVKLSRGLKGRPFRADLAVLIRDCAVALATTSGKPVSVSVNETEGDPPAVQLARACVELVTGKTYDKSLKRQAARVRSISANYVP